MTEISSKAGFVIGYFVFLSIVVFFAPVFGANILTTDQETLDAIAVDFDPNPIFAISQLITRFGVLLTVSSTFQFLGVILGFYTIGFIWILVEMIRGN